jgi:phage terminase large subunit-like protein
MTSLLGFDPAELIGLPKPKFDRVWSTLSERQRSAFYVWGSEQEDDWRSTPATMSVHLAPAQWQRWRYWMLLGEKFRSAVTGVSPRQIWTLPPRYGKSVMASQWGPAWALDRSPTTKIVLASYGDNLAVENARATLDLLRSHSGPGKLRTLLRRDVQRQDRFMTAQGGGVLGKGFRSGVAGFGAHGIVIDDPFKNWQEAHSQAVREAVDMAYKAVLFSRLENDAAWQLLVMTRWHEDDLVGRLLQRMEDGTGQSWELLRIPAVAERFEPDSSDRWHRMPDPLGREPGEVIEPARFSVAFEAERATGLGSFLTAALLQQRPAPDEGGEFKRSWWQVETVMPEGYEQMISSWDMKLKERDSGDFTVGQVWGRNGRHCYLVDTFRGKWTQATTACAIALITTRYPRCRRHIIENTGYGPEVMETLRTPAPGYEVSDDVAGQLGMTTDEREAVASIRRRGLSGLIPNNPKGSKAVRARAVAMYVEAGDVHLPSHAPWLGDFLEELSAFDQGTHDDQVDACSQALSKLHYRGIRKTRTYGEEMRAVRASSML